MSAIEKFTSACQRFVEPTRKAYWTQIMDAVGCRWIVKDSEHIQAGCVLWIINTQGERIAQVVVKDVKGNVIDVTATSPIEIPAQGDVVVIGAVLYEEPNNGG